ncbi:MAG: hypothetical protein PHP92_03925 [Candidatus Nanoarchaeia archaeon]|nr:hypothetical protein [Candidatus Nanoarchaeia archaeon]
MSRKVDLLIIDPQVSFCDPKGELYVKGADQDMDRVAKMILRLKDKWNDIHVTLDTHHYVDVAHPIYWKNSRGERPDPFTIITVQDVNDGVWTPTQPSLFKRSLEYVKSLAKNGRYPLCIWPPHCLIGSEGHNVFPSVFKSLIEWEKDFNMVDYVTKGSSPFTEHYSAVRADVPDADDPSTQINTKFIQTLVEADIVAICGEAGSHCLAHTTKDIVQEFCDDSYVKKLVLLTDGTSPVAGFEKLQEDFITEMTAKGMQLSTTEEFLK